jgi:hypothetical protein
VCPCRARGRALVDKCYEDAERDVQTAVEKYQQGLRRKHRLQHKVNVALAEQVKEREAVRAAAREEARAALTLPERPEDFTAFPIEVRPVCACVGVGACA